MPIGIATLCAAALLFVVQPMVAKALLPAFGGSAMVWTTAMLFFQWLLLAAYGYSYWLTQRLAPQRQFKVHITLLLIGAAWVAFSGLTVLPRSEVVSVFPAGSPAIAVLLALAATVGVPYFILATTSPLLQAWLMQRGNGARTYRLYALSNIGSIGGLLAFPFAIEPLIGISQQGRIWALAFAVWSMLLTWLVAQMRTTSADQMLPAQGEPAARQATGAAPKTYELLLLAAVSSTLLLTFTAQLTQDIAVVPLLWVVPLSIYLLTFVLCFDGRNWYWKKLYRAAAVIIPVLLIASLDFHIGGPLGVDTGMMPVRVLIPMYWIGLFFLCMFCHGELAMQRPTGNPTGFYLTIALGSALGAAGAALIAPLVLAARWELIGVLVLLPILAALRMGRWGVRLSAPAVALTAAVALVHVWTYELESVAFQRSLYGAVRVQDQALAHTGGWRILKHGAILHGAQSLSEPSQPTTYYTPGSGLHLVVDELRKHRTSGLRIGVLGLGTGSIAALGRTGDEIVFYELDPMMYEVATKHFTFLRDSKASLEFKFGDGRFNLSHESGRRFDLLIFDAFSSDSVPVHLLTREALLSYQQRLNPDGSILLHISNKYLYLEPVAAWAAAAIDYRAILFESDPSLISPYALTSTWVLVTRDPRLLGAETLHERGTMMRTPRPVGRWTDDYSNLLEILR